MAIDIARRSEGPVDLKNGYGEVAWLTEVHPLVHGYKCVLKAGHDVKPKTYKDKTVVFIFSYGKGYITTSQKAYNIEDVCFFVPDFDHDTYTIHAVAFTAVGCNYMWRHPCILAAPQVSSSFHCHYHRRKDTEGKSIGIQ